MTRSSQQPLSSDKIKENKKAQKQAAKTAAATAAKTAAAGAAEKKPKEKKAKPKVLDGAKSGRRKISPEARAAARLRSVRDLNQKTDDEIPAARMLQLTRRAIVRYLNRQSVAPYSSRALKNYRPSQISSGAGVVMTALVDELAVRVASSAAAMISVNGKDRQTLMPDHVRAAVRGDPLLRKIMTSAVGDKMEF
jgi:hypothetical protein